MKNSIKKTLITCHANADFDSFSSLIGASHLYPQSYIYFPGTQEKALQKYIDEIASFCYTFVNIKNENIKEYSRLIVVDTRQSSRLEHVAEFIASDSIEVIAWDHHPISSQDIAIDRLYYDEIGATASLLSLELKKRNIKLSSQDATLLMLGIHADTASFTYSSTRTKDFQAAAYLASFLVDTNQLKTYLNDKLTPEHVTALNELLESSETFELYGLNFVIAQASSEEYIHDFAMIAPKIMEILPCNAFFALLQMAGKVQVLARSIDKQINVGYICKKFGGGGHSYAASASIKDMTALEVKEAIIKELYYTKKPDMTAADLMSSPIISISPDTSMGEAARTMTRFGIKAVPILDKQERALGWISQEHAARASELNPMMMRSMVSLYMHRNFKVLNKNANLQDVIEIIVGEKQRLLPIVSSKKENLKQEDLIKLPIVGVITRTDIIRIFSEENADISIFKPANKQKERNISRILNDKLNSEYIDILKQAGQLAEEMSCKVSLVGGFVRDILLEKKVKDWHSLDIDFVVEGNGIQFAHKLAKKLNGEVKEHALFLTATVIYNDTSGIRCKIDIATARLEYYEYPAALPTVEISSLKMDLLRRDFSINAMAIRLNPNEYGMLVDFFNGRQDIRKKRIRMLHTLSFVEDPTRILRAIRFEQRYNFSISVQCEKLMQNAIEIQLVDQLSGRRIRSELELILKEENAYNCLARMQEFNLLRAIHPILSLDINKQELTKNILEFIDLHKKLYLDEKVDELLLILLALSRNNNVDEISELGKRLELTEKRLKHLHTIRSSIIHVFPKLEKSVLKKEKASIVYALLQREAIEVVLYCLAKTSEEEVKKALTQYIYMWRHEKVDINGYDLENLEIPKGKIYATLLSQALHAKIDGEVKTKAEQIKLIKGLYKLSLKNNSDNRDKKEKKG